MSQSLFGKLKLIAQSSAHTLLDAMIDLNSIQNVKQHARELEGAEKKLGGEIAVLAGRVKSLEAQAKSIKKHIKEDGKKIDLLLGDTNESNDTAALTLQTRIMKNESQLESIAAEMAQYAADLSAYKETRKALQDKLSKMIATIRTLESQKRATQAKTKAAEAINSAASALETGSIDSIVLRVQDDNARATAELAEALGSINNDADEAANLSEAMQRLQARKKKLQQKSKK